jgi:hypothetical protein
VLLDGPVDVPMFDLFGCCVIGGALPLSLVRPGLLSPIVDEVPLVGTPPEPELVWAFAVVATANIATDAAASNVGIRIRVSLLELRSGSKIDGLWNFLSAVRTTRETPHGSPAS